MSIRMRMVPARLAKVNTPAYGYTMSKQLSPDDWIKASFRALSIGGPQAIRAEPIARALKVSKGSFYWHFADVAALKAAMLDHWAQAATQDVIDMLNAGTTGPADRLRQLVHISTSIDTTKYGGRLAEPAIRDWARYDENARTSLIAIDQQRIEFVKSLFSAHGTPKAQAATHAQILYGALIGLNHLDHQGLSNQQADLAALLELLLV